MNARHVTRAVLGAMLLLFAAASFDGARWLQQQRWNQAITEGPLPPEDRPQPAEVRFAQAQARAVSGDVDAALDRYRALQTDPTLGQAARYNSANLLLRQAQEVRQGAQPGQAIPLIELAKETYREILRREPQDWPARYNLERAQRLLPDPEPGEASEGSVREAERAPTTMRAYAPGLP